jgi:hypothetical protein
MNAESEKVTAVRECFIFASSMTACSDRWKPVKTRVNGFVRPMNNIAGRRSACLSSSRSRTCCSVNDPNPSTSTKTRAFESAATFDACLVACTREELVQRSNDRDHRPPLETDARSESCVQVVQRFEAAMRGGGSCASICSASWSSTLENIGRIINLYVGLTAISPKSDERR